MILFIILAIILSVFVVVFALQNTLMIAINFFSIQINASLALVIVVSILVGAILSLLFMLPDLINNYFKLRNVTKSKAKLEQELNSYKAMVTSINSKPNEKVIDSAEVNGG